MKKLIAILSILIPIISIAQNEVDALRYSQNFYNGSARYTSMGNSLGALGGDFSVLSSNPAGLGVYRSSEFVFTPMFSYNSTSSSYQNKTNDDNNFRMKFSNIGLVATHNSGREEGWITTTFALGYNRIADFNRNVYIEGQNDKNSMTNYFAQLADGTKPNGLYDVWTDVGMAWDSYLFDPANSDSTAYVSSFANYGETQTKILNMSGGMGEYVMALAGNYSNKLYMGGSFGIQSVRYIEIGDYSEKDPQKLIDNFDNFRYTNNLKTTGAGVNFKFGLIFRPVDWIRIGGAIHSPTFFNLHDEYGSSMDSKFDSIDTDKYSYSGSYDYQLTTPFKAVGSLGFIIGKQAIIGAEYEFVDYTVARLRADDYPFSTENNIIQTAYTATGNLRIGAEFKSGPLSIRGGYGFYGSPFRSDLPNANATRTAYTAGFGIRNDDFYFDMAFTYNMQKEKYFIYDNSVIDVPAADITSTYFGMLATFGFKF